MNLCLRLVISCAAFAGLGLGQPVISAVENNYSNIFQGLPNYGIAQGSIFVIFGSGLAPDSTGLQSPPLNKSLDGVSVQITVNGTTTAALLYYVTASQIAGILPSNTPAGSGTITVSSGGQAGAPAPVLVVQSAFGIVTADGSGLGPAAAFDASYNPLTSTNSANPGDVITLWGSGLGPVTGDESLPQPQSLADLPIQVDIGGQPSVVTFHGRSQYPGLDQINVTIPSGATGCFVSVVVRTGDIVSNSPTIPVVASGRTCSDAANGPVQILTGKSVYSIGQIRLVGLTQFDYPMSGLDTSFSIADEQGQANFWQFPGPTYQVGFLPGSPSAGSCVTRPFPWPSNLTGVLSSPPVGLDAGPAINVATDTSKAMIQMETRPTDLGLYASLLAMPGSPPFFPAGGGSVTLDNGSGGPGVGAFGAHFDVAPPLVWSNMKMDPIDRSKPLTIAWTGGDPQGVVVIQGNSYRPDMTSGVQLWCEALVSAHQFTIPASALLALPPYTLTASGGPLPSLYVRAESSYLFSVPGLDSVWVIVESVNGAAVPYQ